jgi:hypothetical protein
MPTDENLMIAGIRERCSTAAIGNGSMLCRRLREA